MVNEIHNRGMTFGAADNDLHDIGDTYCCCGVDNLKGFANIHTHQNTRAVFEGRKSGRITYDLVAKEWCPTGSVREIVNYECRQENGTFLRSIRDFVEAKWDTPFKSNAPTEIANVQPGDKVDDKGHIIYKYINRFKV